MEGLFYDRLVMLHHEMTDRLQSLVQHAQPSAYVKESYAFNIKNSSIATDDINEITFFDGRWRAFDQNGCYQDFASLTYERQAEIVDYLIQQEKGGKL